MIELPNRVWFKTRIVDGVQLWGSREWLPGEKLALIRSLMGEA